MAKLAKQKIPFTQVANAVIDDEKLSWKAKGLFAYLFSKPEGWDFAGKRIAKDSCDGSKSTYSGLKELEVNGYIERKKLGNGRIVYSLKYTEPITQKGDLDIEPDVQNGKQPKRQTAETGTISNIDSESNTEKRNNKKQVDEIISLFKAVNPAYQKFFPRKNQREAVARLLVQWPRPKLDQIIKVLPQSNAHQYAPTITSPLELEDRMARLRAFIEKQRTNQKGKTIIGL